MIGTFWNLCRACPSMPVDKLHSEYRSTYKWHEYTGPRQEVVRHPPQSASGNKEEEETKCIDNTSTMQGITEPAIPRRKKNPSLAYRTNEFISTKSERDNYYHTSSSLDRARCAGRDIADGSCRRSKSEGPPGQSSPDHQRVLRSDSDPSAQQLVITNFPIENCRTTGLKNAINRISTEYRLQFAWPRGNKWKEEDSNSSLPRKSLSMGAIKPQSNVAPVHKKQRVLNQEGNSEMEPLVTVTDGELSGEEKIVEESFTKEDKHLTSVRKSGFISEYTKKYRPFSQYDRSEGKLKTQKEEYPLPETWFSEVIELRKKAGQYKHRGWGTELVPEHIAELYSKQVGLWEQVSRRSSLSALSLASSTHRSISKEEKEKENNKKSSPTKSWSQKHKVDGDGKSMVPHRSRFDTFVRHHLERTTGVGEEGILHSPTREKLEPVIPRRKDTVSDSNTSPQKSTYSGRSQSAGSPKKLPTRPVHKTPPPEKRQRPTTLQTAPTRTKSRTGSVKAKSRGPHKNLFNNESKTKEEVEVDLTEPVIKSPPEPTRVKSPEQIVMRSPEPVNWTVPLDTGKTFTVTQNVVHGDLHWRAHSEGKARSESSSRPAPPPPSQSAPPALPDPKKDGDKVEGMRCLDDPSFSFESDETGGDVLQKAHSRFDQFWGASQDTQEKHQSTPTSQF